jgi:hypothetical protein
VNAPRRRVEFDYPARSRLVGDRMPFDQLHRREFIMLLGSAAAWPLAAWAQQSERMRRIGILLPAAADDAGFQAPFGAFLQALALLGWTIGRNVRIDTRWATVNAAEIRRHAAELVALAPDVILAPGATPPFAGNRLSEAVICALLRDFSEHGAKAIAKVRRTQPAAYLKICALLVPRENKVEHSRKVSELNMLDPPTSFATRETWERHLAYLH